MPPGKRPFTKDEQFVARSTGEIRAQERFFRRETATNPVDGHPAYKLADRDDGIGTVRYLANGNIEVEVSVVDLPAHIAKDSPLDLAARKRGTTHYYLEGRDSMFPSDVEAKLSLEDGQKRLALTAVYAYERQEDQRGNISYIPRGMRFERTLANCTCYSYGDAAPNMNDDTHDLNMLTRLAAYIREHNFPKIAPTELDGPAYMDQSGLARQGDVQTIAVAKMIETWMLKVNHDLASIFNDAHLPFLYRVHEAGADGEDPRARYSAKNEGHHALTREGIHGAYAHMTSPLRRYPDVVNQRMQHYALDVVEAVKKTIKEALKEIDPDFAQNQGRVKETLNFVLWERSTLIALLKDVGAVRQAPSPEAQRNIEARIAQLEATLKAGVARKVAQSLSPALLEAVLAVELPYTQAEMESVAEEMNTLVAPEEERLEMYNRSNLEKWRTKVQEKLSAGSLEGLREGSFTALLSNAARSGTMTKDLHAEMCHRLEEHALNPVQDYYSILILSKNNQHELWRDLKKKTLNALQTDEVMQGNIMHDPVVVMNNILDKAQKEGELPQEVTVIKSIIPDSSGVEGQRRNVSGRDLPGVPAVVMAFKFSGEGLMASPTLSVGHNMKVAERYAKFSTIRDYAFGEMTALRNVVAPPGIFWQLNMEVIEEESRRGIAVDTRTEILKKLVESMDGVTLRKFGPQHHEANGTVSVAWQVASDERDAPVVAWATATTEAEAEERAATRVFRNIGFKYLYSEKNPVELGVPNDPHALLEEYAAENGWKIRAADRANMPRTGAGNDVRYTMHLSIEVGGVEHEFSFSARNKNDAIHGAYRQAYEEMAELGKVEPLPPAVTGEYLWGSFEHTPEEADKAENADPPVSNDGGSASDNL
jgi:hypothetical protein